jgi:Holliday junction resolvase
MGKAQRDKGARAERDFAKRIGGHRVPLSGSMRGYKGDVVGLGLTWECKVRSNGFKQIYEWLDAEDKDALAIKADRKEWLVVMPLSTFLKKFARDA